MQKRDNTHHVGAFTLEFSSQLPCGTMPIPRGSLACFMLMQTLVVLHLLYSFIPVRRETKWLTPLMY